MKPLILLPTTLVIFLFLFGFSSNSNALILGNSIQNGDFEDFDQTSMSLFNYSDPQNYGWSNEIVGRVGLCLNKCTIQPPSICLAQANMSTYCMKYISGADPTTPILRSSNFIWQLNRTWGLLNFYVYGNIILDLRDINTGTVGTYSSTLANSSTKLITFNITGFTFNHIYTLDFYVNNPPNNYNFWLDNMTFNSGGTFVTQTRTSYCQFNFVNDTADNITYDCQTTPLNLQDCAMTSNSRGSLSMFFYQGYGNGTSKETIGYVFNSTKEQFDGTFFPIVQNYSSDTIQTTFIQSSATSSLYAVRNTPFSTCYYVNNNSALNPRQLQCYTTIDCSINYTSSLNGNCSSICLNGYLYNGGFLNNGLCFLHNATQTICPLGCGSTSSCTTPSVFSNIPISINTTNTFINGLFGTLLSSSGLSYWILIIFAVTFMLFLDNFATLILVSTISFLMAFIGLAPPIVYINTIIGFSMAYQKYTKQQHRVVK